MDRVRVCSDSYDDPTIDRPYWHPKLADTAPDFPWSATFALRKEEALFIQEQLTTLYSSSLLAFLANHPQKTLEVSFWDSQVIKTANSSVRETVELARRFSLFVESMLLVYNLMLAGQQAEFAELGDAAAARVEEYQFRLEDWHS